MNMFDSIEVLTKLKYGTEPNWADICTTRFKAVLKEYFKYADTKGEEKNADAGKTFSDIDLADINNKRVELFGESWK